MKIYIAGPMTGYVNKNRALFYAVSAILINAGHQVFNPADSEDFDYDGDKIDVRTSFAKFANFICLDAEAIFALPGWELSRGARAETALAEAIGLPIFSLNDLPRMRETDAATAIAGEKAENLKQCGAKITTAVGLNLHAEHEAHLKSFRDDRMSRGYNND